MLRFLLGLSLGTTLGVVLAGLLCGARDVTSSTLHDTADQELAS